ncbi:hypothetical protein [Polyangium spumosum]|uniref:Uncharacterized protein n=1 Tax=Polyangium spumosum TaxID=889282 RepID=A0A6N7PYP1_9BACT|nr:hypothetical protein [Polyangium spumosum]MRG96687.1 hypothetical protein [Polyangium spumosum]
MTTTTARLERDELPADERRDHLLGLLVTAGIAPTHGAALGKALGLARNLPRGPWG